MKPDVRALRRMVAGALGLAGALVLLGGTLAQASPSLPASIIAGSCASPGAVATPLADLGGAPAAGGLAPADAAVIPVATGVTTVAMKLADLADGAHAVTVSLGGGQAATVAACGNLGTQATTGDVVVGLAGSNGSRYTGIAWLHPVGDQTQVTVFLTQNPSGSGEGGENENEGSDG